MQSTSTSKIRELNDLFRSRLGIPQFGNSIPGAFVFTPGIIDLSPEQQITIWQKVREFNNFTQDNDPYEEHDFGAFDLEDAGKIFWKIDYYDPQRQKGSEDPSDPEKSFRLMTIMLASEY